MSLYGQILSLVACIFGGTLLTGWLNLLIRTAFVSRLGLKWATVIAGILAMVAALILSTLMGMGRERFLYYSLGAAISSWFLVSKIKKQT